MKSFIDETRRIFEKGMELKKKYTDDYKFDLDYLNIFAADSTEYDDLIVQAITEGTVFEERKKGVVIKLKNTIVMGEDTLSYVQIAKPNRKIDGMKGYLSYSLYNFEELKDEFSRSQNILLVEKQDYLRLEIIDPTFDVMVYLASDSLIDSILNPKPQHNFTENLHDKEDSVDGTIDEKEVIKNNSSFEIEAQLIEEKGKRMQLMADFQNYQKRIETEKSTWGAISNMSLIREMLEVNDDIELAIKDSNLDLDSAKQSMKTAQDKLTTAISATGVERIPVNEGDEFDKEKMEAVSAIPVNEEDKKNKVIAVISSAYKYKNKEGVLKAAKVVVGK